MIINYMKKILSIIKYLNFSFIDNLVKFIEGIGIAAFILIFIVFLQYLYIPIFYNIDNVYIIQPNINYELLNKVEKELLTIDKDDNEYKNIIKYDDPFIR